MIRAGPCLAGQPERLSLRRSPSQNVSLMANSASRGAPSENVPEPGPILVDCLALQLMQAEKLVKLFML